MAPIAGQPPTVAQATAGTDLVWKYHPRSIRQVAFGTAFMSLSQFQQYQTREIDRAVANEQKQHERDAKNAKKRR